LILLEDSEEQSDVDLLAIDLNLMAMRRTTVRTIVKSGFSIACSGRRVLARGIMRAGLYTRVSTHDP
jgi:hypothetical protein